MFDNTFMRKGVLLFLLILLTASCQSPPVTPSVPLAMTETMTSTPLPAFDELIHIFDYDPSVPLDARWGDEQARGDAILQSLTYLAPENCRAQAILVRPDGPGPYPAIIYMHRGGADKTQFEDEAVLLAGQGVVALLLDAPFLTGCGDVNDPRQGYIRTVLFVRRGVDLLESLPQVDPARIAYVGHSFGATWGGVLAGVEPRLRVFVLMAGYAQISQHDSPEVPDLDAVLYVGHAEGAAFLFQFSTSDHYISQEDAQQYYDAASGEKTILWYDSTHAGLQEDGQADRLQWLGGHLGFAAP